MRNKKSVRVTKRNRLGSLLLAPAVTVAASAGHAALEEVVVTATKRAVDIQDVAASISAMSGTMLEARQIDTMADLSQAMPNLTFSMNASVVPNLSIRGVSADGVSPTMEGAVALHIDGIYQPRANLLDLALADIENVEVLRGPQGTLYGRNANAGVINLMMRRPTETFEGSATLFGGSFGRFGSRGHVSGPITDALSFRVSGLFDKSSGYADNLYNGHKLGGHDNWGLRGAVQARPSDTITIDLSVTHTTMQSTQPFFMATPPAQGPGFNYSRLLEAGDDGRYTLRPWKVYNDPDPRFDADMDAATLTVNWDIGERSSLKSLTGYQEYEFAGFQDQDAMPVVWSVAMPFARSHTFTQELNWSSQLTDNLDLIVGLYYLEDSLKGGNINPIPPGSPYGLPATAGLLLHNVIAEETSSTAVFADATWAITDRIELLAGVRRTFDRRDAVQQIATYRNADFDQGGEQIGGCAPRHEMPQLTFNSTTGKVGIRYALTENVNAYLTWQDGFKSGGYSSSVCDNSYEPEEVRSWEAGIKGSFLDNRLSLALSLFDYRYTNMQLSRTFNQSPSVIVTIVDNAASADLHGGELEATLALSDAWQWDLSLGVVKSEYGQLVARNGAVPGNPEVNIAGNTLPRSPELTLTTGLEYQAVLPAEVEMRARAEYRYTGKTYFTPFEEAMASQDAYGLFNATLAFTPLQLPVSVQLYGRNLTNEAYFTGLFTSGLMFNSRGNWGEPRNYGMEVTLAF